MQLPGSKWRPHQLFANLFQLFWSTAKHKVWHNATKHSSSKSWWWQSICQLWFQKNALVCTKGSKTDRVLNTLQKPLSTVLYSYLERMDLFLDLCPPRGSTTYCKWCGSHPGRTGNTGSENPQLGTGHRTVTNWPVFGSAGYWRFVHWIWTENHKKATI